MDVHRGIHHRDTANPAAKSGRESLEVVLRAWPPALPLSRKKARGRRPPERSLLGAKR